MTPADEKPEETTEAVEETVVEETPAAESDVTEADGTAEEPSEEAAAKPAKSTKKPAAAKKAAADEGTEPKPKRTRAKKADAEPKAEEPVKEAPKPARKAGVGGAGSNGRPVVKAHAKYVRTSARKARLVCDHIRGKSVIEARAILQHTPRAVAEDWEKLLESAVANAEHNHELLGDDLKILSVTADEGPTLKRFRPRAMGRASRIRKRTSHLSIALTPKEQ
jgi:ribosomal protein L22